MSRLGDTIGRVWDASAAAHFDSPVPVRRANDVHRGTVTYTHPKDHPDHFVLRRWYQGENGNRPGEMSVFDTAEEARAALPGGLEKNNDPRNRPGDPQGVVVSPAWRSAHRGPHDRRRP
jgi:hypothetical protein